MTNAEAINVINQVRDVITKNPSWTEEAKRAVNEAADMSIKALKKRIPQIVSPATPIKRCRNCGRELSTVNVSRPIRYYCVCGQIIDWKDKPWEGKGWQ
jgi:hypothetical protein